MKMNHPEAIRLNNLGASMMLAGRDQESSKYFAQSLGMLKQLLAQSESRGNRFRDDDASPLPSPLYTHDAGPTPSFPPHLIQNKKRRRISSSASTADREKEEQQSNKKVLVPHRTLPIAWKSQSADPQSDDELFYRFGSLFFLQAHSWLDFNVLKCHCACVIFNMGLLHHKFGLSVRKNTNNKSLDKAEQLYRLAIQILKDFVLSLTDEENSGMLMDVTSMLVMMASLNNLSHLLWLRPSHERIAEAASNMHFLSRLLNASRDQMLGSVVSEATWSDLVLNGLVVDQRLYQSAGAA